MAKWFWKDGGQNGNVEVGVFREQMRDRYVDGVLKAGVLVEAVISDSENQETAYWCVQENGNIVDSGTTMTVYADDEADTIWAFDLAQKAAEAVITKMPEPKPEPEKKPETVVAMPRRTPRSVTNPNYVRPSEPTYPDNAEQPYMLATPSDVYDDNQRHWWESDNAMPMVASN